ncbi:hypothetical protein [Aquiflexum sp.]|uniref:hypothetical protein n=1 Tax=Aquiflexum sp. TaxID=1872584 RepID=UPI00359389D9
MRVDFRVLTWEQVEIPEEHEAKVLELLASGEIKNSDDLYELIDPEGEGFLTCDVLQETEQLSVFDNGECSTIEVIQECEIIWQNGES